jgi:hypothetical protein
VWWEGSRRGESLGRRIRRGRLLEEKVDEKRRRGAVEVGEAAS